MLGNYEAACRGNPGHTMFLVRSESGRVWIADSAGRAAGLSPGEESVPGFEDVWECRVCGTPAVFEKTAGSGT